MARLDRAVDRTGDRSLDADRDHGRTVPRTGGGSGAAGHLTQLLMMCNYVILCIYKYPRPGALRPSALLAPRLATVPVALAMPSAILAVHGGCNGGKRWRRGTRRGQAAEAAIGEHADRVARTARSTRAGAKGEERQGEAEAETPWSSCLAASRYGGSSRRGRGRQRKSRWSLGRRASSPCARNVPGDRYSDVAFNKGGRPIFWDRQSRHRVPRLVGDGDRVRRRGSRDVGVHPAVAGATHCRQI